MSKVVLLILLSVFLSGCIEIIDDDAGNLSLGGNNISLDLNLDEEEQEESYPSSNVDLDITNIYWSTLFPDLNEADDLNIRVTNKGNESVDGFNYKVTLFKAYDKWKEETYEYDGLVEPGQEVKISEEFSFDEPGRFKAEAYVDWDNSVKETDELNNYEEAPRVTVSEEEAEPEEQENEENETENLRDLSLGEEDKCLDSDDGLNYYEKGRCIDDGPFILGMNDYCKDNFHLVELYCTNNTNRCRFADPYECYCKDGACV